VCHVEPAQVVGQRAEHEGGRRARGHGQVGVQEGPVAHLRRRMRDGAGVERGEEGPDEEGALLGNCIFILLFML
jgi:hypothetical protein